MRTIIATSRAPLRCSVGMVEVRWGPDDYLELGSVIDRSLKEDGLGLIHTIGQNIATPMSPWFLKRCPRPPPTLREMMALFEPWEFTVLDVENLRLHYAKTWCRALARAFRAEPGTGPEMFDEYFAPAPGCLPLRLRIANFRSVPCRRSSSRRIDNLVPMTRSHLTHPPGVSRTTHAMSLSSAGGWSTCAGKLRLAGLGTRRCWTGGVPPVCRVDNSSGSGSAGDRQGGILPGTRAAGHQRLPTGLINGPETVTDYGSTVSYGIRRLHHFLLQRSGACQLLGEPVSTLERRDSGWLVNGRITARLVVGGGAPGGAPTRGKDRPGGGQSRPGNGIRHGHRSGAPLLPSRRHAGTIFCRDLKGYAGTVSNIGLGRMDRNHLGRYTRSAPFSGNGVYASRRRRHLPWACLSVIRPTGRTPESGRKGAADR